ncbi:hypothetical protein MNB_SV-10-640 [hydrothermal vent metagenome]|uniref:Uncharacterized protein n=1 Tax=hydrothermal vent metagenome TaxID=652676 RepID=A0A1W1BHA3_9ZZZZ
MKKRLLILIIVFLFQNIANADQNTKQIRHYDPSAFIGWDGANKKAAIKDVSIELKRWDKKEQRVALSVKTKIGSFQDNYLFCEYKGAYFYCAVEDDGGYVKMYPKKGIQVDVDFSKEGEEGPELAFHIEQKEKKSWIPPLKSTYSRNKGKCFANNISADRKLFLKVLKRYPDISPETIHSLGLARYFDTKYRLSLAIPSDWIDITKMGDDILYLSQDKGGDKGKFKLRVLKKFWSEADTKYPKRLIAKTAKALKEMLAEEVAKTGDNDKSVGSTRILEKNGYTVGHFVMHHTGKKRYWVSYTLIWDSKRIYVLNVIANEDELALSEFLSALGMESFCSEGMERVK